MRRRTTAHRTAALAVGVLSLTAVLAAAPAGAAPADAAPAAAAPAAHTLTRTVEAGGITRSQALDAAAGRLYLPIDRGELTPGAVTWIDAATGEPSGVTIELTSAEPSLLAVNADRGELYVSHYRDGVVSVVDTATGTLEGTISGAPRTPVSLDVDPTTGDVYATGDTVVVIDPETRTAGAPVAVTTQRYPLVKDAVFDDDRRVLWVAEGRGNVITAVSAVTGAWVSSLAIPVGSFSYDGERLGGRAAALAVDEELGHLYAAVAPTLSDTWDDNRLITIDTTSGLHLGSPITLGETTREIAVNPVTHEVYAANGFSNTLGVVSPATWSVSETLDFTAAGVTSGTGAAEANVWSVVAAPTGTRAFVTHPYRTARTSVVDRTGDVPAVTPLAPAPGQVEPPEPEQPVNPAWPGPEATASPAPLGASALEGATLAWSVSDYASEWTATSYDDVARASDGTFAFTGGTGWQDPATGATRVSWSDGFRLHPYPGLAPDVTLTFGNPTLSVDGDGSGDLVMDVAWTVSPTVTSDGYARVQVATFAPGEAGVAADGTVTFTRSPEYAGRSWTAPDGRVLPDAFPGELLDHLAPDVRPWFYASGSSLDATKVPTPVTATWGAPAPLTFADVPAGMPFAEEIGWLAERRVTTGWVLPDGTREFRPVTPVARDAMAAFLYRLAGRPAHEAPTTSPFVDVAPGDQFYDEITWLYEAEISTGWVGQDGAREFRPLAPVARDAMAAFLFRFAGVNDGTADGETYATPATSRFADVTPGTQFFTEMSWLADRGISTGWPQEDGPALFGPLRDVNRDAMAAFMYRLATSDVSSDA
ncbi:HtaA domain-containing protein [Litorihabitans aurantiacus]|uniref:SLH domain-containing protein n=1 Tax=Litorihabitans aurantiacus TaxID=1930061 RepID=A0AA37XGR6_9MICO|nr:HtaA domain-containing protein [Litorihabitans aurantiacus]GMA32883.1 hypothetical protein GCM10025875_28750 [Litorihabitans aurantiacus]